MGRHIDIVPNKEKFKENLETPGYYTAPWVVYIGSDNGGYDVAYSSDEERAIIDIDYNESIITRLEALEHEKVYCYEDEYENLVKDGFAYLTGVDGNRGYYQYDSSKLYCIYEDEGPVSEN